MAMRIYPTCLKRGSRLRDVAAPDAVLHARWTDDVAALSVYHFDMAGTGGYLRLYDFNEPLFYQALNPACVLLVHAILLSMPLQSLWTGLRSMIRCRDTRCPFPQAGQHCGSFPTALQASSVQR